MDKIIIEGPNRLVGEVTISGSKNATLPILSAALLTNDWSTFYNVPKLRDIATMKALLLHIGAEIQEDGNTLKIRTKNIKSLEAPYELVKTMRASSLVLGPLLTRFKRAKVSLPGGCAIGARPLNLHLMALEKMGADIKIEGGYINTKADKLKGARIYFDISTVTGTENIMMAAALADGVTVLENAAQEPEVVELAEVLNKMGARIKGAGTDYITIEGVDSLRPITHTIMPDRIEAGTFMIAAGMTKGDVIIKNCPIQNLETLVMKLKETGVEIKAENGSVRVSGDAHIRSVDIKTLPYPGFPTDMQAQMMAMMGIANGLSVITENVFENRFMHVSELKRMGADIKIEGRNAIIKGRPLLSGAPVMATDLRASASLVLAGLAAGGITEISRVYHLDRGYERIEEKLAGLGAKIKRVKE
ncbi:MAG: UDP-N-acetylglucosamine 1-carboxyvinyltransferase [Deltaproteobacteria bacterium GWC2_42_51]|nr:MAG: UDP-N-acetylglucosamine 1-carboxyvinyltransferase [Deltaproteobacteria bacterium GWA2_42_85]OGP31104.1 MAG: UDP-N-acetylglucosamine 1-carboxyvinyltransferase [Deltaproteobacteria bacterium GWC2_42_51]OGP38620.1 MAG: UDP-N-acetylglucosamine 1-carboxyvinyltransferase [Deltaproteobacteria bacterium GWD2_42_10]OGP48768.1 MAG: UDP-N-acetylglucosamine 1-carboxyvinyltransferase [Deltaproteobacteria bacterium GWF2_42_12]OGQ24942.1 MAG: UDP-N-acetylglucosamine 1-carboxyvinyltransferase [Deltapro